MDANDDFDMGDTVRLKIGGPAMTLLSVSEHDCCCMWFGERGRLEHGSFELDAVERVERAVRLVDTRHPVSASRGRARESRHP